MSIIKNSFGNIFNLRKQGKIYFCESHNGEIIASYEPEAVKAGFLNDVYENGQIIEDEAGAKYKAIFDYIATKNNNGKNVYWLEKHEEN